MGLENKNAQEIAYQNQTLNYSELKTFLKYCSNAPKVIEGLFKLRKIRFTQPWVLNDPLEFNPIIKFKNNGQNYVRYSFDGILFPSEEWRLRYLLIEQQVNKFGILSLTKIPDSFDMWSRYANGHKGFLIEFKSDFNQRTCMVSQEGREYPVKKVNYVDEYAIDIDLLTDVQNKISIERFNEEMFYKKCSRWQSECEYRIVRPLTDCQEYRPLSDRPHRDDNKYLFEFDLDCIESITFGACMSIENKKYIISSCEGKGIKFAQACISRDEKDATGFSGNVYIIPKDNWPGVLEMLPFSFVFQKNDVEHRENIIEIDHLSALPYYKWSEKWIEEFYRIRKTKRNQKNKE